MSTREHETQPSAFEPPVIDLAAEEVEGASGDTPRAEPPAPPPEPRPRKRLPWRTIGATVLTVAAVIAGALLYRSFGERLWPSDRTLAVESRVALLDASSKT